MCVKGSNLSIVKKENSQLIRKILYDNSPISRTEIAQRIALSLPTVTSNISKLISCGAVKEITSAPEADAKALGRRPVMLDYAPDYGYYIGVELSPYWTYLVITDLRGRLIFQKRNPKAVEQYSEMVAGLGQVILENIHEAGLTPSRIIGVGVCLPGFIDAESGSIYNNMRREWSNHKLAFDLEKLIVLPVRIENNVRARAIGFDLFHREYSESPLLYYFISHGIGCSMIVDRNVISGASAGAGEVGHTVVAPHGPLCQCGNRGCLEVVASEQAIVQQCRQLMRSGVPTLLNSICAGPDALNISDVLKAQACNDTAVVDPLNRAIGYIGLNIANLANFISPQAIVIDSNMFSVADNQRMILEIIQTNTFSFERKHIHITFLPHDSYSGAIGAAAIAVKAFFLESSDDESWQ